MTDNSVTIHRGAAQSIITLDLGGGLRLSLAVEQNTEIAPAELNRRLRGAIAALEGPVAVESGHEGPLPKIEEIEDALDGEAQPVRADGGRETTYACPECDYHDIVHRSGKQDADVEPGTWACRRCGAVVDEPIEREKNGGVALDEKLAGPGRVLNQADPDTDLDDLATDGGTPATVYARPGKYGLDIYHVDPDCPRLTNRQRAVSRASLPPDAQPCQWCGREEPPRGDPNGEGHLASLKAAAERDEEPELRTDGGEDLRTYRDVSGLLGPVDVREARPEWADYAVGEAIAFRSPDGVLTRPVIGYSTRGQYRGLPAVWFPDDLREYYDDPGGVLVITEEYHVPPSEVDVAGEDPEIRTDGGLTDLLYPTCPTCGQAEGIHRAVVGPASPEGYHDVERFALACGHEARPDVQIEAGVVDLLRLQDPDAIAVRGGGSP